jgi:putative flippase GtrA
MRWVRFNLVGIAGFLVQMLTLAVAADVLRLRPGLAVSIAVFVAVTHNFFWHEYVTWPGLRHEGRFRRWLSFNLSNGLVSLVTNLAVTTTIVEATGIPLLAGNALAVLTASVVNFLVSDHYIFNRQVVEPLP